MYNDKSWKMTIADVACRKAVRIPLERDGGRERARPKIETF